MFDPKKKKNPLKIIPLSGVGRVTKNLFVYEDDHDIVVVDCGIGFANDDDYENVDYIIPDINYLRQKRNKVRAFLITHGHDDHYAALPHVLPEINVPVYASKLTAGMIKGRLEEHPKFKQFEIITWPLKKELRIGKFSIEFVHITHSVPDSTHIIIRHPQGTIYHGSDFKFDFTPVDDRPSDLLEIARNGNIGIDLTFVDSLRVEKEGFTRTERVIESSFEDTIREAPGKVLITTASSNISRIQQAIDLAKDFRRKVVFVGRSIEKNTRIAKGLGFLHYDPAMIVPVEKSGGYPPKDLLYVVAGSQSQEDSALVRIADEEHKFVRLKEGDVVVFSADPIPGSEAAVYRLIDRLAKLGCDVHYSGNADDLHVSGHGAKQDIMLLLQLTNPQYVAPIGGSYRHMAHFEEHVAYPLGFKEDQIFLLEEGDTLLMQNHRLRRGDHIEVQDILIHTKDDRRR